MQQLSGREIARRLGCDKKVVYRELDRYGIPRRDRVEAVQLAAGSYTVRDEIEEMTLRKLYEDEQLSTNQIAERLNVSGSTVIRRMDELGIARRSATEANRLATWNLRIEINETILRELYEKQGHSIDAIAAQLGVSTTPVRQRMIEYGIPVREHSLATTTYTKQDFDGTLQAKAYLIGFRLGDLWVGRQNASGATIHISCSSTRQAQISLIEALFQPYGRVSLSKPDANGMISVSVLVNESFAFLLDKEDNIESWILEDEACFWAFLAGYVDAEGNIGVYNGQGRLRITTTDEKIIRQIWERLLVIGIDIPKPRCIPMKGKVLSGLPRPGKANKDQWELATKRKSALRRILTNILPYMRHTDRIQCAQVVMANLDKRDSISK